jgi:hypothetical protein
MRSFVAFSVITFAVLLSFKVATASVRGDSVSDEEAALLLGGDYVCARFNTYTCNGTADGCVATTCFRYTAGCSITNRKTVDTAPCGTTNPPLQCDRIVSTMKYCLESSGATQSASP